MPQDLPAHWSEDRRLNERLLQALWSARQPRTAAQFYLWSQSCLQPLLPHQWLVCAAPLAPMVQVGPGAAMAPGPGRLAARLFHVQPLPQALQDLLQSPEHGLWQWLLNRWLPEGRALGLALASDLPAALALPLLESGQRRLLVHGLALGPQRVDSLFLLGSDAADGEEALRRLELLMPALHAAWRRVLLQQRELAQPQRAGPLVTAREQQIVEGLRAGLSNEGIAQRLGISMFTVKNHVRKILRKLGASNRAQAVAIALAAPEVAAARED